MDHMSVGLGSNGRFWPSSHSLVAFGGCVFVCENRWGCRLRLPDVPSKIKQKQNIKKKTS